MYGHVPCMYCIHMQTFVMEMMPQEAKTYKRITRCALNASSDYNEVRSLLPCIPCRSRGTSTCSTGHGCKYMYAGCEVHVCIRTIGISLPFIHVLIRIIYMYIVGVVIFTMCVHAHIVFRSYFCQALQK